MEPIEKPVIVHRCGVQETGITSTDYWFSIEGLAAHFWTADDHGLRPGDRVKITITKEPTDAQSS